MAERTFELSLLIVFFFFQAEDGIRDLTVTGVQTCALPISIAAAFAAGDLSWTQTRLLATAATPDSEHEWLVLARDRTVRALEALVARPPADPDERQDRKSVV